MGIITLTSDWGSSSFYSGSVKGSILSIDNAVTIIDITHQIPPFNLLNASFVLRNSFRNFPTGTVHIIGINTEATLNSSHTVILYEGHYFICSDNSIFSLICDSPPEKIVELNIIQDSEYFTFPSRDVFSKAACHLAKGGAIEDLGMIKENINPGVFPKAVIEEKLIKGSVIFIDNYENIITNITQKTFKEVGKGNGFSLSFAFKGYEISKIHSSYGDVEFGELLALFSTSGLLEIAINQGNASSLLGIKLDDVIRIDFSENESVDFF